MINAATGASIADAVSQNQKDLLDREVLGGGAAGRAAGAIGASGISAYASGRLRASDHDGFKAPASAGTNFSYETNEASAFANAVVALPGTVLGGQLKISGFVGQNWVSLDLKSNPGNVLDPNQSGSAKNDSVIAGGSILWATPAGTYVLGTLVGTWGETTLFDSVDDCFNNGCVAHRYRFNTTGVLGSVTAGQVFSLFGASGPKLDLRGSVGYTQNDGDRFINVHGDQQKYAFSTWTGTGSLTLFSTSTLASGAVLRPYIQAYVRQEWDYKNEFSAVDSGGNSLGVSPHDQSHTYGGVDAGLTYTFQNMTFGAAVYYEASGDERTLGGRLGASVKLDDVRSSGIPARRSPDWEGFYVGANAGHGWGVADATASTSCALTVTPPPLPVPLPGYFCNRISQNKDLPQTDPADLARAAAVSQTGSGPIDPSGFTGGVQAGRNWQAGNVVVGVEFDANAFNLSGSRSASGLATAPVLAHTVGSSIDTDWLVTARGRIGWAASSMLFYATAGLALTDVKLAFSYRDAGGAALDASSSDIKAGLAVGGGLEWALSRNWSVKGEYLFVDFGRVTSFGSVENGAQRSPYSVSTDLSTHIARLGLNYKF